MLIGVKLFGKDVNGAKRWFSLGPLGTFQPSELSKVIMIIVVAAFLAKHQDDLNEPKVLGKLAVICGIPLLLILKQPSLSSTLDICFIILGMIFMAGLSSRLIVQVLIVGVPLLAIFLWYVQTPGQVLLAPHQVRKSDRLYFLCDRRRIWVCWMCGIDHCFCMPCISVHECGEEIRKSDRNLCGCRSCVLYGISVFYQHCSCYRNHAEHRTAPAIYQLWIKFLNVGVDRDRNGT